MHSVSNIFGISCYFETRIAWLDGNKFVETEKLEELSSMPISKLNSLFLNQTQVPLRLKLDDTNKSVSCHQFCKTNNISRFLFVSPKITYTDRTSNINFFYFIFSKI
ncbi:hypothetical protein DDB_G0282621 [Dictyostelium discoideum AX4]|uniref:Uncharacterized protein n=1 Tax=Dictyostelium discoideum TaxID=44689 RepID=Q54S80_DICDI|nr:hypothetical protein DDB_G0282621 [Dictyostelium discoideum AX4]EAL66170.1 hypothetical protein DDB_G0282621 [Dictyostelium discoideum AX4]|eukprot:XP_640159.1 hypothetical protein DDB_G0282621 [Dictyostelium discoideum AX4]